MSGPNSRSLIGIRTGASSAELHSNGRILNSADPTHRIPATGVVKSTNKAAEIVSKKAYPLPPMLAAPYRPYVPPPEAALRSSNAERFTAAAPGGYFARSRLEGPFCFCQKNAPLVSRPIWAKLTFVVALETNLKPCPVLFLVVAVTAMVADVSKKSPEN